MTTSLDILNAMYVALLGSGADAEPPVFATSAGDDVKRPGDLPTQSDQFPRFKLKIIRESRTSLGRGEVQFQTSATIRVIGEVSAPAKIGDVAASTAEPQLWALKLEAEIAIINSYPLFRLVEQLSGVETQFAFTGEQATHLAGIQADYSFDFYEGPEDFAPIEAADLEGVDIAVPTHAPLGATIDLSQQ